ncbi:MAG: S8 family serine peptidase, partial [Lysobacteraceae bacterium]
MSRNWLKHAAAFVLLGCAMAAQAQTSSDQSLNELLAPLGQRAPEAHRAPQTRPPATVEDLADRVKADGHVDVIVLLALDAPFRAEGHLSRADVQLQRNHIGAARTRLLGALPPASYSVNRDYESIPAIAMRVDEAGLAALRGSRLVAGLEEDALKFASLAQSTPLIGAPNAWASGYDGSGWTVAILDTGIEAGHPFFRNAANASRVVAEACFSKGVTAPQTASLCPNGTTTQTGSGAANANTAQCLVSGTQLCDHGTHVAGIAAGRSQTVAGQTINGVAPNANIIAIQVFTRFNRSSDCNGSAPCIASWDSDQLAALNYINTTLRPSHNIASVNMSLGGGSYGAYCDTATIKTAVDNLRSNGIATVIATGNDGYRTTISSPACISTAVAVSSTSKIDVVSGFSNVATIMDLFAPGSGGAGPAPWNAGIGSSVPGSGYALMSGTSMATPQVAGAWAVLKQAAPTASVTSVLNALVTTGTPVTDTRSGASGTITKPRINVDAAAAVLTGAPTRTVTSSVGTPSGTITPTGAQTVAVNGKAGFNLYPAAGQEIDSVTGTCGGTLVGNRFTTNPVTANCTVIANFRPFSGNPLVCGTLNHSVIQNGDGSAFTLLTGLAQGYSASRLDDINLYVNGGQMWVWWYGGLGGVAAGGQISVLPAGTTVGPASTFSNANQAMNNWLPGRTGYIGMAFDNASTGQRNYGWLRMTTAGTSGYPATWHDYCYDQSGAPITTGSVPVVTYPITVSVNPAPGGSASCTPNPVTSGGNSACSASANTGYTFSSWSGDCTGATCSLTNVTSAKAVTANFTLNSYTVTATSGGNGTITPASQNVSHGGTASFTVTPATGYHVVSVAGDT